MPRSYNNSNISWIEEYGVRRLFKSQLYAAGNVIVDICIETSVAKFGKRVRDGEMLCTIVRSILALSYFRYLLQAKNVPFAVCITCLGSNVDYLNQTESPFHCEMPSSRGDRTLAGRLWNVLYVSSFGHSTC
jgi:hypothetical protein